MQQSAIRPIGDLFRESIEFVQKYWQVFVPIALLMALIPTIDNVLFPVSSRTNPSPVYFLLSIIGLVVTIWASTAAFYALKQIVEGETTIDVMRSLQDCKPLIVPLFLTSLITGVIVGVGFILLIIPGVIFLVWGFASTYVYLFEGIKYFDAFKRSKELATGHFTEILVRLAVLLVALIVVNFVLSWIPYIGPLISSVVIFPFTLFYSYLLYKDLRDAHSMTAAPVAAPTV